MSEAKFFNPSNPDVNISVEGSNIITNGNHVVNGGVTYNSDIKFNSNVSFNGGGQIGINNKYPDELVISADGFETDGSCISLFQQDNDRTIMYGLNDKGAIKFFSRDLENNNCTWLAIHNNPSKILMCHETNIINHAPGIHQYLGYLTGIEDEYYSSEYWYRKWTNGWCDQGGRIVINSSYVDGNNYSTASLTFPIAFTKCYHWLCQAKHDRFNVGFVADDNLTSSVSVYQVNDCTNSSFSNPFVIWYACGYWK